jgi:hypothetical protein
MTKAVHQELDESARIDADSHLHVRLHRIHANRFEPVASRNDAIDGVTAIANRLTTRESAIRLDVNTHTLRLQNRAIDYRADRQRIMNGTAAETGALIGPNLKPGDGGRKTRILPSCPLESRDIRVRNQCVFRYV